MGADTPITRFRANTKDIRRLLEIHSAAAGSGAGYKHDVAVLHKSAIVLLVACWESFVEDLAEASFDALLAAAADPQILPARVRVRASRSLRENKDERLVWQLAGSGWRSVLLRYKKDQLASFHAPRPDNVDELFECMLDGPKLSASWHWQSMSVPHARKRLDDLVTLRGAIAHRVASPQPVHKKWVKDATWFVTQLATRSSNAMRQHLGQALGRAPWPRAHTIRAEWTI